MNKYWRRQGKLLLIGLMATVVRLGVAVAQEPVMVESNLIYGAAVDYTGSNVSLTLDAYYVNGTQTNRPVVILTHGGGFGAGDKGYTVAQGNFYPDMATPLPRTASSPFPSITGCGPVVQAVAPTKSAWRWRMS